MPRRSDLHRILVIGSGPIVIGQAAEFDYSGTQATKALREEGYEVILVNSNPATIMTDPEFADRTYIEPVTAEFVEKIIAKERPDAVLPTMGGQTALNVALKLYDDGVLDRYGCELIGANARAIRVAEDRKLFAEAMEKIGLKCPTGTTVTSLDEALAAVENTGFPAIIRPSFTLGGTGGGIAYNREEFETMVRRGLDLSPVHSVLIERSLLGWKEYELEVMRDCADNVVIVCSIENLDPMGVHTGDSITVAPAMTLTDREYQVMRDAAVAIIREIGVDAGGCNVQFAVNPRDGELIVIEMNPRVSRSSALASKATGFPIARIGAKLAVGYTLDEVPNDITKTTPASFEPVLDYVIVKCPRFAFEKFAAADPGLTTQMKSVGESMAIGRTFKEAFQKALRALETGRTGWSIGERLQDDRLVEGSREELRGALRRPTPERIFQLKRAMQLGMQTAELHEISGIDPWFLDQMRELLDAEATYAALPAVDAEAMRRMKRLGFSDRQLAALRAQTELEARALRWSLGVRPSYKMIDTCAGEFPSSTPYLYGNYDEESEAATAGRKKVVILGSGPNRIGQGVEFDYCCVRAVLALRQQGYETIMVNSNPETVSTDFDISDKLYFEPLTLEDVLEIVEREQPEGVIVQLGGQTPLKLTRPLEAAGVRILGTSPDAIDTAEDRRRFEAIARELGIEQPANGTATSVEEAVTIAQTIGFPVLVRPSYVLGGRAMEIVHDEPSLRDYFERAARVSEERPVLVDRFLEDAFEADVDALSDGEHVVIGAVMEHIESAGIHSGDSACILPPYLIPPAAVEQMKAHTMAFARRLGVVGLINVQYAYKDGQVYVIEVNPRASRTAPFVSKAIGVSLPSVAARLMLGETLAEIGFTQEIVPPYISVKEAVFPFNKFREFDPVLSPEMRSTGEVMGIDEDFGTAFLKSQIAADNALPSEGAVFFTVNDGDKPTAATLAQRFHALGFSVCATSGTAAFFRAQGVPVTAVLKVHEGRPHGVDLILNGEIQLLVNTPLGKHAQVDDEKLRQAAIANRVPYTTTLTAANAAVEAIAARRLREPGVRSLQEWHEILAAHQGAGVA
ncbi:MAG: carbamoyl-phosphate synthase large subunit [Gemmatimonas sp.]|jgi:carbamoyl-phosphate synthase large subunit|uniref:carbamoyl-phosphate synthase large subunit n=1 Tax=Gemmatimonas sp. TaxID=1962908 RepID=UPI0022C059E4|nr:carbamoyl-phosphate synthase large subunit [Gemmatimonas sp.]MCE2954046.1 carbamoyl-phosphate synthase large subunit [Gemmatimonas sp.]MCZ8013414.1 carbamoyl-phosphate synthase large subunit [Gemmatimonas sp.]MCZ8268654.1 carbamoyl-phosphate synthase large subunit [Gemmatimonas sp.]